MSLTRRGLFGGMGALLVAPAIVRASSLMAVKPEMLEFTFSTIHNYTLDAAYLEGLSQAAAAYMFYGTFECSPLSA